MLAARACLVATSLVYTAYDSSASHLRSSSPVASALLRSSQPLPSGIKIRGSADLTRVLLRHKRGCDWELATATLWNVAAEHAAALRELHVNIVLSTLAAAQPAQYERACTLLSQMREMGLRPDPYSYSSTIAACSRAGQPERALAVFRQCCAEADSSARPNAVVFNAMLLACQRAGPAWQPQLIAIFAGMMTHGIHPNAWAHSAVLNAYAQKSEWTKALELLDVMERQPNRLSPRPDGHCYAAAMRACLHAHEHTRVLDLHERMITAGLRGTAYTLVPALDACAALARAGDHSQWQHCQQLFEGYAAQADGADLNAHCFAAAARVYAECGRPDEALGLLKQMRSASPPIAPNAHVLTAVIASLGPSRQWRVAMQLLHGMARAGVPVDAHCVEAALKVTGRAGNWQQACRLFRSMASEFGVTPTPIHLTTVLQSLAAAEKWHVAAALLEEVFASPPAQHHARSNATGYAQSPNSTSPALFLDAFDARLCATALTVCAKVGAWERALMLLEAAGEGVTPAMRRATVVTLIRAGEWSRAEVILDQLQVGLPLDSEAHAEAHAKLHLLATAIANHKRQRHSR